MKGVWVSCQIDRYPGGEVRRLTAAHKDHDMAFEFNADSARSHRDCDRTFKKYKQKGERVPDLMIDQWSGGKSFTVGSTTFLMEHVLLWD